MALSKHFTHYGSWSGFPYYNLRIPHQEGSTTSLQKSSQNTRLLKNFWNKSTIAFTKYSLAYKLW